MNSDKVTFDDFYDSNAYGDLYREYRAQIADIVQESIDEIATQYDFTGTTGQLLDDYADEVRENIEQTVDSHGWVIYTGKAALVDLVADADSNDWMEDSGYAAGDSCITPELRAYACMIQDANERLQHVIDREGES